MQQQEAFAAGGRAVAAVQPRDAEDGDVEQRVVARAACSVSASDQSDSSAKCSCSSGEAR